MEMPKRLSFTIQERFLPDVTANPYEAKWSMYFQGKPYGGSIDFKKLDPEYIKTILDVLADEVLLTIQMLNEPLLGRHE